MLKRITRLVAVVVLATTVLVTAPSRPAEAADLRSATGCGFNVYIPTATPLLPPPIGQGELLLEDLAFACVIEASPIDLGFAVLPLGTAIGAKGAFDISVQMNFNTQEGTAVLESGYADACLGFSFDIRASGGTNESANFSCLSIRTYLKDNGLDPNRWLPQFTSGRYSLVEGVNAGRGAVNGLPPLTIRFGQVISCWEFDWVTQFDLRTQCEFLALFLNGTLPGLIRQVIAEYVSGPLTDPVQVNLKGQ